MSHQDTYQNDLAYIHDTGFGGFASGAAPGILSLFRENGITEGIVVDLGCGSGIWARALADSGYAAEIGTLTETEVNGGFIKRLRHKKIVFGAWWLYPITRDVVAWARKRKEVLGFLSE